MKKSKLIELLNSIEGNPDIVFWNGFVDDYQDISTKLAPAEFVKQTFDNYRKHVELDRAHRAGDWSRKLSDQELVQVKKNYKQIVSWELNELVDQEDIAYK